MTRPARDRLVIGTRGSRLALAQARWVAERLRHSHPDVEPVIQPLTTQGDRQQTRALPEIGVKGLFTRELEQALLDGRIDLAVHSAKDLPTDMPAGLAILAIPAREDPRDALIGRHAGRLADLPANARIGTSSLRRQAQLRLLRGDLRFVALRGNVDTRVRKVHAGVCEAAVLAMAGLKRSDMSAHVHEVFDPDLLVPAPGQGALAVQGRADDEALRELLGDLHDEPTATAVQCERRIVQRLGAGCRTPVGVLVRVAAGAARCHAVVLAPDGSRIARACAVRPVERWSDLADAVAAELIAAGADEIIRACRERPSTMHDGSPRPSY